jgi:phosphoribosyl-AMP cyclohydrolase
MDVIHTLKQKKKRQIDSYRSYALAICQSSIIAERTTALFCSVAIDIAVFFILYLFIIESQTARFISVFAHCQMGMNAKSLSDIDFEKRKGLLPVVVQDRKTKDILMLAYANKEALANTIKTGNAWFWSTSRNKLWMKGEESGNVQPVYSILVDCDSDSILYMVDSDKPACHTGNRSCFHNLLT